MNSGPDVDRHECVDVIFHNQDSKTDNRVGVFLIEVKEDFFLCNVQVMVDGVLGVPAGAHPVPKLHQVVIDRIPYFSGVWASIQSLRRCINSSWWAQSTIGVVN